MEQQTGIRASIEAELNKRPMQNPFQVSLLRDGLKQILEIPQEFALRGTEVLLRKEGQRLVIEPVASASLLSLLKTLPDISDSFADFDEGLLPLDDVTF